MQQMAQGDYAHGGAAHDGITHKDGFNGPLAAAAPHVGYVKGPGDGRDDLIDAKLANGEWVMDAETVAMLGNGSNEAGAKVLDEWREELRRHKGKVLAKGKFSPDAKHPNKYLPKGDK
jgi:hypothetical protein